MTDALSAEAKTTTDELIEHIRAIPREILAAKAAGREQWPVRSNRASVMGHPCLRFLVYNRIAWNQAALPSVERASLMEERKRQEDHAVEDLRRAGYTFLEQQRPFSWDRYELSGKIDGQIGLPKGSPRPTLLPAEIKHLNPWLFEKIDESRGIEQFLESDFVWTRMAPYQMTSYLLMNAKELGVIVLRNPLDGLFKVVPVRLDWELGEQIVSKCEAVLAHMKAGTLPERVAYDEKLCGSCDFFSICLPDQALLSTGTWADDPEILKALERRAELAPASAEYKRLDDDAKDYFKKASAGQPQAQFVVAGRFVVTVQDRVVKAEKALRPARTDRVVKIEALGGAKPAEAVAG